MCKNWNTRPLPQELNAFNDLPTTVSRKYAYVDDLATMHADGDWLAVKGVLIKGGRLDRELNAKHEQKVVLLLRAQLPRSNAGQIAHVTSTARVTSQEADITRPGHEAACWLRLGC